MGFKVILYKSKGELALLVQYTTDTIGLELKVSLFRKQTVNPRILPKNEQMNSFLLLCDVFSFVFWENPRLDWFAFEINWPLGALTELSCSWIVGFKSEFWRKLPVDCTNKATNLFWLPKARSWCFCLTHEDAHWAQWLLGLSKAYTPGWFVWGECLFYEVNDPLLQVC